MTYALLSGLSFYVGRVFDEMATESRWDRVLLSRRLFFARIAYLAAGLLMVTAALKA